jgi:hypothetical protein
MSSSIRGVFAPFLLILGLFAVGLPAAAQSEAAPGEAPADELPPEGAQPGVALNAEEMRAFHSGKDLTGCYYDQPEDVIWSERMAADGRLYDLEKNAALVGRWWIEGEIAGSGVICFVYTDRPPGPYCFTGRRRGAWLDFYSAQVGVLVATTQCGEDAVA